MEGRPPHGIERTVTEEGRFGSNFFDRDMRSERHFWASMNYIHNNAVHHGYVKTWQEWPYSSSLRFLNEAGRESAAQIWNEYPTLDYGKGWDIY
jgi:putative transposase